jgi:mannose-6-phosphate isomerase-like protein (cupin superfamily)
MPPSDGEERVISIPDFVGRNFIGKENAKESMLSCTRTATTRVLQVQNILANQIHADVDEVLYVVAGEGAIFISEHNAVPVGPGSLSIIPRSTPHTIERRKKNPLILLSTLSGVPCAGETTASK